MSQFSKKFFTSWGALLLIGLFFFCTACPQKKKKKVVKMICLGDFSYEQALLLQKKLLPLLPQYQFNIQSAPLPNIALTHIKSKRYRADSLLNYFQQHNKDTLSLLLTNHDISCTKKDKLGRVKEPYANYFDWGVMGLAYLNKPICIASTYRLQHPDKQIIQERLEKVGLHEIGHTLGLPHCEHSACIMNDAAERIATIDKEALAFCNECKAKL